MRLPTLTWIVLGIAIARGQPPAPRVTSAETHFKQAEAYRSKGDSQRAIGELRQALALKPDLRDAHGMLGEILLAQDFAEEAVPHLERAGHLHSLAVGLTELNRLPEALHHLLALYRQTPEDPDLLFHLGEASGKLMQEAFDRLIRTYPDSPRTRELKARRGPGLARDSLVEPANLDRLLAEYVQQPSDPEALFRLGEESENVMQEAFNTLLKLHPNSARAQEFQARSYLGQQRGDLAEPLFRGALKLSPGLAGVHLALGRILLETRGDLDGAEREFRAEVRLHPGNAEAAWRLGSVLLKKAQAGEALAVLQQSDKLKPNMLETLLELGKAYTMANQLEQAEKIYRRMIEIEDTDELAAAAHLQLSQIYRKMGDPGEAEHHLKRVRELNSSKNHNAH
jgi:tetratricopeptide (TPR) repeat protein